MEYLLVLLTLAGLLSLAGLFVYLAIRGGSHWRKKMDSMLLPIGFEACKDSNEVASVAQRLHMVNARHAGKRLLMNLYRGSSALGDFDTYVCDYRFSSTSGRARGGSWILVCLMSRTLNLPRFTIESIPEAGGVAGRLFNVLSDNFEVPGLIPMEPTRLGLDQRFRVYVEPGGIERVSAYRPCFSSLRNDMAGVGVYVEGDTIALSSLAMIMDQIRQDIDPQKLRGLIHLVSSLYLALMDKSQELIRY